MVRSSDSTPNTTPGKEKPLAYITMRQLGLATPTQSHDRSYIYAVFSDRVELAGVRFPAHLGMSTAMVALWGTCTCGWLVRLLNTRQTRYLEFADPVMNRFAQLARSRANKRTGWMWPNG